MREDSTYRAARRNAARLDTGRNRELRDMRRRLGLSRKDYDRLQAKRISNPASYGLMMSWLQTKENAVGYVIGPKVRYHLTSLSHLAASQL